MNAELLLRIAEMTEEIPEDQFDLGHWWHPCGSIGCAIGHAMERGLIADWRVVQKHTLYRVVRTESVRDELGLDTNEFVFLFGHPMTRNDTDFQCEVARKYDGSSRWAVAQRIKEFVYRRRPDLRPRAGTPKPEAMEARKV